MDQSEKRRKKLLEETRHLHSDRRSIPAVHPRYKKAYSELYDTETSTAGTFGLRVMLCLLLFACFITMDYTDNKVFNINSSKIEMAVSDNWTMKEIINLIDINY